MSEHRIVSLGNPWFTASVVTTGLIAAAAAVVGLIWLPALQGKVQAYGLWDTICSAAGLFSPVRSQSVVLPNYATTQVEVTPEMLQAANAESVGRGATLALRCTMCHGARGLSEANSPNLAGQYAIAVYKQLRDFKSGARVSAVMAPLVADLSDRDMRDLSAYYAYLPRLAENHPVTSEAPRIVMSGAPMRNIPPCGACHGRLTDKAGGPWLDGQPAVYLQRQLLAFATGVRRNDINEQMRNVARQMTPAEIDAATRYYGAQP
jgi:cytochrome c553